MSKTKTDFDVVVIGGGTCGLAATYYAAAAGYKTANFEQYKYYNEFGSSDGYSRMFRVLYSEADMAMLTETSLGLWTEIEQYAQACLPDFTGELLSTNGLLFYGMDGQTVEGDLREAQEVMTALGIPFRRYSATQMKETFNIFRDVPDHYFGLTQASGATIEVQKSLRLFHDMAAAHGAKMHAHTPIKIKPTMPGAEVFTIETPDGDVTTTHLIIAAGSWSNNVVRPLGLQFDLSIWQMTVAYFDVDPDLDWQMWYEFGKTDQDLYYGFPPLEYPNRIKVSCDYTHDIFSTPEECTHKPDPKILEALSEFVSKRFNGIQATPHDPATCLYTMSSDAQIIMDTLPGYNNVSIITGESGRAFKYTPLFGRILSQLATTGQTPYDISEFRINRPGTLKAL